MSFWQVCGWLSLIQTSTDTHMGFWQTLLLTLFSPNTSAWPCFSMTGRLRVLHFCCVSVTSLYIIYIVCHSTDACGSCMGLSFALPYAALFMFSFYPAIHHSSVPWFKLWATLTELMHWSELGQVWNMNWLHAWVWLWVWPFSLLHVLFCAPFCIIAIYFLFCPIITFPYVIVLTVFYLSCIYTPTLLLNTISFILNVLYLYNIFPYHFYLRLSQFLMNYWLGSLVTRRPSAQWLPSNHADANFTVQLDCASHCHHPGGRVPGMLGRVIPPVYACSAVSLVGSCWN